jgi:hypothetical protein
MRGYNTHMNLWQAIRAWRRRWNTVWERRHPEHDNGTDEGFFARTPEGWEHDL